MKKLFYAVLFLLFFGAGLSLFHFRAQAGFLDFFYKNKEALTVSGNKVLLDEKEIVLRGVAVGDVHSRDVIYKRTTEDYKTIKDDWRANFVRLSVLPGVFKKDEDKTKKILEKEIEAARDNGLYVVVDWHVIGFPNGWYKPWDFGDYYGYSFDSNFKTASDFWKYMAVEYRGDRGVIFELWNEPADENKIFWNDVRPYMERLYEVVRSNGADNIVVASSVWWTYDLRDIKETPLDGENIGYAWHNYPGSGKYSSWGTALDGLEKDYPIFVTEWGFTVDPDGNSHHYSKVEDYPDNLRKYMLDKNLNFTAWCWHNPWDPRMFKNNDWTELNDYGQYVKNYLRDIERGIAPLMLRDYGWKRVDWDAEEKIMNFVRYGSDFNTYGLGEGERKAVVFSYQLAFDKMPGNDDEIDDMLKIANGHWPDERSESVEDAAREVFSYIYKRAFNENNSNDVSAVMIMAYGLRQRAENRNLESEKAGIEIFKSVYGKTPATTEEWNIMQAITYSGAKR